MNSLRGSCGVSRWDEESKESVHEGFGVGGSATRVDFGVITWGCAEMVLTFDENE